MYLIKNKSESKLTVLKPYSFLPQSSHQFSSQHVLGTSSQLCLFYPLLHRHRFHLHFFSFLAAFYLSSYLDTYPWCMWNPVMIAQLILQNINKWSVIKPLECFGVRWRTNACSRFQTLGHGDILLDWLKLRQFSHKTTVGRWIKMHRKVLGSV